MGKGKTTTLPPMYLSHKLIKKAKLKFLSSAKSIDKFDSLKVLRAGAGRVKKLYEYRFCEKATFPTKNMAVRVVNSKNIFLKLFLLKI